MNLILTTKLFYGKMIAKHAGFGHAKLMGEMKIYENRITGLFYQK